jgi:hypothetical protein
MNSGLVDSVARFLADATISHTRPKALGRDHRSGHIEAHKDMVYSCTNAIALDTNNLRYTL